MRKSLVLAALAATATFATPAFAQAVTPAPTPDAEINSKALILQPATIVAGSDLDFGTVLASATAGTVTVNADPAAVLVGDSGGATAVTGAQRGSFEGNGEPNTEVTVTVTSDPLLRHSLSSDSLTYRQSTYGAGKFLIRPDGLFTVLVGGEIDVAANQKPGQYSGKVYVDAAFQ